MSGSTGGATRRSVGTNRPALRGPQQEQPQEQEQQQGISMLRHVLYGDGRNSLRFTERRPVRTREDDSGLFPVGGARSATDVLVSQIMQSLARPGSVMRQAGQGVMFVD